MSDLTVTTEEAALADVHQRLEALTTPDREREAQERARLAEIDELHRKRAELEAEQGKKARAAQVAEAIQRQIQARKELADKAAAWLEIVDHAHEAHREAFFACAEAGYRRQEFDKLEATEEEARAVCDQVGLDFNAAFGPFQVIGPVHAADVANIHPPSGRVHQ